MDKRSYHQFCPLAYAMDILGERWTFLILRELAFGPRRFKDLLNGLPGIGTNLLSQRLKELERHDVVIRTTLPPPAGTAVYALGPRGQELAPVIGALASWGVSLLKEGPGSDFVGVVPVMGTLRMLFDAAKAPDEPLCCEVRTRDEVFQATLTGGALRLKPGSPSVPDVTVMAAPEVLLSILGQPDRIFLAAGDGRLVVLSGKLLNVQRFFESFRPIDRAEEGAVAI